MLHLSSNYAAPTMKLIKDMNNKKITSKLLKEAVTTLTGIVKHPHFNNNVPLREIRIHMLDEDGDGIGLWIEFNEVTEEFDKGMMSIAADMMEDMHEHESEHDSEHADILGHKDLLN